MSSGYACLNIGTPHTNIRGLMQKNATQEKLMEVTVHNLQALEKMIANKLSLYRISLFLFSFGSRPAVMSTKALDL